MKRVHLNIDMKNKATFLNTLMLYRFLRIWQ
jgi:hypothetical protein